MRKIKSCGVLVVQGDPIERFLLMVHKDRLDLPKGHVDAGETNRQCALRELYEETSITDEDIELDPDFRFTLRYNVRPKRFDFEECQKKLVVFLGRLVRDVEIVPAEHEDFRWVAWDPPHSIQKETIDPLLAALEDHIAQRRCNLP